MLDIRFIRDNAARVEEAAQQKGYKVDIAHLLQLDDERREVLLHVESLRQKRNEVAASLSLSRIGAINQEDQEVFKKRFNDEVQDARKLKTELAEQEDRLRVLDSEYLAALKKVPNMPMNDVPIGASEDENVVAKTWGEIPKFTFEPKNHWEIAEKRDWIDKERAAKVAGARFAYIKGDLALLWMALVQFGFNVLTSEETLKKIIAGAGLNDVPSKPFIPILPPLMIRTEPYDMMDRLEPRDDRYKIEGDELWLQGSAEHVLGSMHMQEILSETDLPLRYAGYATSFRQEAGTYGKDTEGIFRMHQFDKMEMESLTTPEKAFDEHLFMVAIQEYLMQQLELPYQVLQKCTADIGKPNARGIDIEAWLPGQNKYRETHTADYMTDYQSRRLQTRYRRSNGELELVHTNDATAFAQRPLIAIIENYQNEDGTVRVPVVLRQFLGNRKVL